MSSLFCSPGVYIFDPNTGPAPVNWTGEENGAVEEEKERKTMFHLVNKNLYLI
jgi:hypothetical protein